MTTLITSAGGAFILEEEFKCSLRSCFLEQMVSVFGKVVHFLNENVEPVEEDEYVYFSGWDCW